jgi:translation initiation factor IF-3
LNRAKEEGVDLVEVAPSANPPVAKLIDFKKFKYEENKKLRLSRRGTHESSTKEVWLGPLMSDHDLDTRLKRAKLFLSEGDRVKFTVKFSGREMNHPEFGHRVLGKVKDKLVGIANQDGFPRFLGRNLSVGFLPEKKTAKVTEPEKES